MKTRRRTRARYRWLMAKCGAHRATRHVEPYAPRSRALGLDDVAMPVTARGAAPADPTQSARALATTRYTRWSSTSTRGAQALLAAARDVAAELGEVWAVGAATPRCSPRPARRCAWRSIASRRRARWRRPSRWRRARPRARRARRHRRPAHPVAARRRRPASRSPTSCAPAARRVDDVVAYAMAPIAAARSVMRAGLQALRTGTAAVCALFAPSQRACSRRTSGRSPRSRRAPARRDRPDDRRGARRARRDSVAIAAQPRQKRMARGGRLGVSQTTMNYPDYRPRRMRRTEGLRRLMRETRLAPDDFIYPMFVVPGSGVEEADPVDAGHLQLVGRQGDRRGGARARPRHPGRDPVRRFPNARTRSAPRRGRTAASCRRRPRDQEGAARAGRDGGRVFLRVHRSRPLRRAHRRRARQRRVARESRAHRRQLREGRLDVVAPSGMLDGFVGACRESLDEDGFDQRGDHGVLGEVRVGLLRPVPRRRRVGAELGRSPRPSDGSRQRRRGAARGVDGCRRGRRHRDGQAGARVPRRRCARSPTKSTCRSRATRSAASTR